MYMVRCTCSACTQVLPPESIAPAFSCRSGLSVLMSTTTAQGADALPFRLDMKKTVQGSETFHVVGMQPRTLEKVRTQGCRCGLYGTYGSVHAGGCGAADSSFWPSLAGLPL